MQSWSGSKQDMYHCIRTQKSSMIQFGAKERLDGDKSTMKESRDIGWNFGTPRQHKNIKREIKDGLCLGSINCRDMSTHDG